jgi:hypothetical protein
MSDPYDFTSNLSMIQIYALRRRIPDEPKVAAHMTIFTAGEGGRTSLSSPVDFSGRVGIETRGQSSQGFPKKQYGIELWDRSNDDLAASLLGMPAESDWILQGPYSDKTLMRNWLAYHLSNAIGRYAVRTRFVEAFKSEPKRSMLSWWQCLIESLLGRKRSWPWRTYEYVGVYVLMEKIKRDQNRVAITPLNPGDATEPAITGGYILKIDKSDLGEEYFVTDVSGVRVIYEYPRDITAAQKTWISDYVNAFDLALNGPNFSDPVTGYFKYIDVDAFVDYLLFQELFRNVDGFRISTFLHKDRNGKLMMGPLWDFDIAMGNANYYDGYKTDGWLIGSIPAGDSYQQPSWWPRLLQDANFVARVANRWQQLRQAELATTNLFSAIEKTASLLQESQARNFAKWPILGQYVWPNPEPYPPDYAGEIRNLKTWLKARAAWIDANITSL